MDKAKDHDGQRKDHDGQRSRQPGRLHEVRVCKVEAEFAMARDHDGQAEFAKSGRVRKVQAKFTKSRPEITTARRDHDGQARTTAEITMARQGQRARRRRPGEDNGRPGEDDGRDDDGQAEFATATVRSFRPIQVRDGQRSRRDPLSGG